MAPGQHRDVCRWAHPSRLGARVQQQAILSPQPDQDGALTGSATVCAVAPDSLDPTWRSLCPGRIASRPHLPDEQALRRSIGELAAIGRNLNQIAKAANDCGRVPGSAREEFRAMLKVCEALRDNTKGLLKVNVTSWESGHGEDV